MVAALLLLPIAIGWFLRRAALRARADDSAAAWFGFWRWANALVLVTWIAWPSAVWLTGAEAGLVSALRPFGLWGVAALVPLVALGPPAMVTIVLAAFSHAVSARLRGDGWTLRETVLQAVWQQVAILVPFLCLALLVPAVLNRQPGLVAAFIGAALVSRVFLVRFQLRSLDLAPHAVTTGELRDRVFALAVRAGVKLRQLYIVPMARGRIANAFAVRGGTVVLTDYLLAGLTRREMDAVLAHELAHLKRGHPTKLLFVVALTAQLAFVLAYGLGAPGAMALGAALGFLCFLAASQRFERQADLGAVELTGDPEGLISALARLSRLNTLPLDWGRWSGSLLTHPSTRRRALAVALKAGISAARVDALLRDGCSEAARYEVPPGLSGAGKVFSTLFKSYQATWTGLAMLAALALGPAAVLALVRLLPFDLPGLARFGGALAAALALSLAAIDRLAPRPYHRASRALAARLAAQGLDCVRERGRFVGLAPSRTSRIYEGFSDWDVGFLFVRSERLCYVGEETRFALRRDQVDAVRLGPGVPGWLHAPRVLVEWRDEANGRSGVLSLRPADATRLTAGTAAARRQLDDLDAWARGRGGASIPASLPMLDALEPPRIGEVTGLTPREVARPRTLVPALLLLALFAAGACALFGLPFAPQDGPGFLEALAAAVLIAVFHRIPWWHWREPTTQTAERERKLAA